MFDTVDIPCAACHTPSSKDVAFGCNAMAICHSRFYFKPTFRRFACSLIQCRFVAILFRWASFFISMTTKQTRQKWCWPADLLIFHGRLKSCLGWKYPVSRSSWECWKSSCINNSCVSSPDKDHQNTVDESPCLMHRSSGQPFILALFDTVT